MLGTPPPLAQHVLHPLSCAHPGKEEKSGMPAFQELTVHLRTHIVLPICILAWDLAEQGTEGRGRYPGVRELSQPEGTVEEVHCEKQGRKSCD